MRLWTGDFAIRFCLERTLKFLTMNSQSQRLTQVIFESHGKRHDQATRFAFDQILKQANHLGHHLSDFSQLPLDQLFIPKRTKRAGHQLYDSLAKPLAKWSFNASSHRRPMQIIQPKLIPHKVFPQTGWRQPHRSRRSSYWFGKTRPNPPANSSHATR